MQRRETDSREERQMGEEERIKRKKEGEGMRVNKREGSERQTQVPALGHCPQSPLAPSLLVIHDGDEMVRLKLVPSKPWAICTQSEKRARNLRPGMSFPLVPGLVRQACGHWLEATWGQALVLWPAAGGRHCCLGEGLLPLHFLQK